MHDPRNLPDLGSLSRAAQDAAPAAEPNGGVASIDRRYRVVLTTADGTDHDFTFRIGMPQTDDGLPDLGALKDFDPPKHVVQAVAEKIMHAWYGPPAADTTFQRVTDSVGRPEHIVWRHVVSFRYAGPG